MGGFSSRSSSGGGSSGGNSFASARQAMTSNRAYSRTPSRPTTTTNYRDDNRSTQYTRYTPTQVASGRAKVEADIATDNAKAFRDMQYEGSNAPSLLAKGLDVLGVSKKAFDTNKAYYEKNVIGKNNFTASPDDFRRYMAARGTGEVDAMGRPISGGNDNDNTINKQGIELAKASTTSATISGPGEIQKEAANTIKGPTTTEMSAAQINVANKRKGRKSTNITAKKILNENYTLSKKTLLG